MLLTNAFLIISIDSCNEENIRSSSLDESEKPTTALPMQSAPSSNESRKKIKLLSLAESIKRSRKNMRTPSEPQSIESPKDRWKSTLQEIKDLAVPRSSSGDASTANKEISLFRRWRMLLNEPTKLELDPKTKTTTATIEGDRNRSLSSYSGSWERILQDWSDDVQDYMEKIESENKGYPMSQFGNAEKLQYKEAKTRKEVENRKHSNQLDPEKTEDFSNVFDIATKTQKSKKESICLPVPAPKKLGADVVPHTDIGMKSKRILIVTTAALPWMTGTAVNQRVESSLPTNSHVTLRCSEETLQMML